MATVTARFDDARTLQFADGTVTGDPVLMVGLEHPPTDYEQIRPDGPTVATAGWRTDPWSFVAACVSLGATDIKTFDVPPPAGLAIPEGAV
jgi:hypothetical protein